MGWGIEFKADISLNRASYQNAYEINDKIEELNREIEVCKAKIKMFSSSTLKDVIDPDWKEQPIDWLNLQIEELLKSIEENTISMYNLRLYLEYLKQE